MVIKLLKSDKVVDPGCYWCGHARVQTKKGRVLRATDAARDYVCNVCSQWKNGSSKLSGK